MEYRAKYGIDCGVSNGFALKSPDYITRTEALSADNEHNALLQAAKKAIDLAEITKQSPK